MDSIFCAELPISVLSFDWLCSFKKLSESFNCELWLIITNNTSDRIRIPNWAILVFDYD